MVGNAWAERVVARPFIRRGCGNGRRSGEGLSSHIVNPTHHLEEDPHHYEHLTQEEGGADLEQ